MTAPFRVRYVALCILVALFAGCANMGQRFTSIGTKSSSEKVGYNIARLHERNGKLSKARSLYEELAKRDPENHKALHRLGVVSMRMGDHDVALRQLNQAAQLDSDNVELLCDLGYAHYLADDLDSAERVLRHALRNDTQHDRSRNNLALVVGFQGRTDESLRLFKQVVSEAEAHANVAYIYAQLGQGQLAMNHYSRALSLDDDLETAAHALVQFADMQNQLARRQHHYPTNKPEISIADRQRAKSVDQADIGIARTKPIQPVQAKHIPTTPQKPPAFEIADRSPARVIMEDVPAKVTASAATQQDRPPVTTGWRVEPVSSQVPADRAWEQVELAHHETENEAPPFVDPADFEEPEAPEEMPYYLPHSPPDEFDERLPE